MKHTILYHDSLLEITDEQITLQGYYFPSLKPKEVMLGSIEKVEVKEPSMRTGKYRFQGTGDLKTWFPMDASRNTRDKIFFITIKDKWVRIGFTGENSGAIEKIFRDKGLLY